MRLDSTVDNLKFILAFYRNTVVYYDVIDNNLSPAQNISNQNLNSLKKLLKSKTSKSLMNFSGVFPKNLVYYNQSKSVVSWVTSPIKKHIFYKDEASHFTGFYNLPYLFWTIKQNELYVFSIMEKDFSSSNYVLYNSPFFNVNSKGSVCMGNVKWDTSQKTFEFLFEHVEKVFFDSFFTHSNNSNIFNLETETVYNICKNSEHNFIPYLKKSKTQLEHFVV